MILEVFLEEPGLFSGTKNRYRIEIPFEGIARKTLKCGLGAEYPRRPSQRWIPAAERPENAGADPRRHACTHSIFHHIELIPAVSGEIFVASVPSQRNRYVFPGYA